MPATVDSMLTTTPFFSPRESWLPMPSTSSAPSGAISATSAATLEVPMSRPTTRLRFSLGMSAFWSEDAQREAVRVAQVDVLVLAAEPAERFRIGGDEAREAVLDAFGAVAPELQRQAARETQLPGVACGQHQRGDRALLRREAERRQPIGENAIAARKLALGAGRPREQRQARLRGCVETGRKGLAEGIDEAVRLEVARDLAPARERNVLFQPHLDAVGPDAARFHAPHPAHAL